MSHNLEIKSLNICIIFSWIPASAPEVIPQNLKILIMKDLTFWIHTHISDILN